MNKAELEKEVNKLSKLLEEEKKTNAALLKAQKRYINMATDAGSELAPYEHMAIRLDEELTRLKSVVKRFKGEKK